LLTQPKREGKASAINLFLSEVKTEIVILESADTIPEPNTIENLIKPFQNPQVGMTGGHPIPLNNTDSFIDFTNQLLWELHHQLALKHPKLGELVAFRNIVQQIPKDTITDEACIEAIITGKNYKLQYVPEAVVRNKGQANVVEFITRRRNLYAGHIQLTKRYNYAPSTMNPLYILQLIFKYLIYNFSIKNFIFTLGAILLEVWVRVLGMYDYHYKRSDLHIWKVAKGSKELEQR
jgi:cellulose synthase/poly-beta-1,6-N-acetylglucosamine synthase-like glycosyltransferase